ncbi:MAG: GDP-mannose 4,6-dehydratase, partial [Verrucomicrobiota bacterium]
MSVVILGVTGQDGSYLAELLLEQGDSVHGVVRRTSQFNRSRIEHLRVAYPTRFELHYADLSDSTNLRRLLRKICPHRIYHLAGQSHVGLSFNLPESTFDEVAVSTLSLLEICRDLEEPPRVLLIGSSEVFGDPEESPQNENTRHRPTSPYGCAKSAALFLGGVYRQSFGLFVASAIPYNHESIRRGMNFVTRKITNTVVRISRSSDEILELGNLDGTRDWGFAPEYVEGFRRILEADEPDNFVLATGVATTVRDFASVAFETAGIPIEFEGDGVDETGRDRQSGRVLLKVNPRFFRPADPCRLKGNASKAKSILSWEPITIGPTARRRDRRPARRHGRDRIVAG